MTTEEQIKRMRLEILGDEDDDSQDTIFGYRLEDAKVKYLTLVYPFDHNITELPDERAQQWQVRCAIELYKGHQSEWFNATKYSENGLSITFATAGISKDLLQELPPPHAKVPVADSCCKEESEDDEPIGGSV